MDRSDVTVLVVTHRRPGRLDRLLASLAALPEGTVRRVVVVDDTPESAKLSGRFPGLEIRHLTLPERVFISRAKNLGLREVSTPLVYFIDDDNVVDAGTFGGPTRALAADPGVWAVMPSVLYARRPELVWVYATPWRPDRWGFDLVGRNRPRERALEERLMATDALPNASLVRRAALESVGGFDESLPVNSSADLCRRLQLRGGRTLAHTGSFIYHDVEPPGSQGFWAQHSVDPDRLDREIRDWFVFHRRLREGATLTRAKCLWHAAPFLLATELAFVLRRDARFWTLSRSALRSTLDGLGPLPPPRYGYGGEREDAC